MGYIGRADAEGGEEVIYQVQFQAVYLVEAFFAVVFVVDVVA